MNEPINFYRTGDPYGEFSNFAPFPIVMQGVTWPTTEHYFQAQKFADESYRDAIRLETSQLTVLRELGAQGLQHHDFFDCLPVGARRS